jgi:hypothetical protein
MAIGSLLHSCLHSSPLLQFSNRDASFGKSYCSMREARRTPKFGRETRAYALSMKNSQPETVL